MKNTPANTLNFIINKYFSVRDFARTIGEDPSDCHKWRWGSRRIPARAVVKICRLHLSIKPHELNPCVFPEDLSFKFEK